MKGLTNTAKGNGLQKVERSIVSQLLQNKIVSLKLQKKKCLTVKSLLRD